LDVGRLKEFARAFMEDAHEICNVSLHVDALDPLQTEYNIALRHFRHAHPWLHENLAGTDRFNRVSDDDRTIFYGLRTEPRDEDDEGTNAPKQVAMVVHMGGDPTNITLGDWLQLDLDEWQVAIASPGVELGDDLRSFELKDSQAVLLESRS
jgi:hypothetical protein